MQDQLTVLQKCKIYVTIHSIFAIYASFIAMDACILSDQGGLALFDQARNDTLFALRSESNITTPPYSNPYAKKFSDDGVVLAFAMVDIVVNPLILLYAGQMVGLSLKALFANRLQNVGFLLVMALYILPNLLQPLRNESFREVGRFFGYYQAYLSICSNHTELAGCDRWAYEDLSFKAAFTKDIVPGMISVSYWYLAIRLAVAVLAVLLTYCLTACCCDRKPPTLGRSKEARVIMPSQRIIAIDQPVAEPVVENTLEF